MGNAGDPAGWERGFGRVARPPRRRSAGRFWPTADRNRNCTATASEELLTLEDAAQRRRREAGARERT